MYDNEITYTCTIKIDGTSIKDNVAKIEASFSEDDYVNSVIVSFNKKSAVLFGTLCDPEVNFGQERVTLTIDAVQFDFLLEKRTTELDSETLSFSIWGRSKAALLDMPYSIPFQPESSFVTDISGNNYMASQIMQKAIDASGESITLQFLIDDFVVHGEKFIVENKTPIQIINELAAVSGGRVRSGADGNLIVDYKRYSTSFLNPSVEFTDIDSIIQIGESIDNPPGYNKVRIIGYNASDIDARSSLKIELDGDYEQNCLTPNKEIYIRVYPSPIELEYEFNTSLGTFVHLASKTETVVDEIVTFTDGKGSVSYPVESIVSSSWIGTDLGTLNFLEGFSDLVCSTAEGYGMLRITYTTHYDSYIVISTISDHALLYALELLRE